MAEIIKTDENDDYLIKIKDILKEMKYGSIHIIVQDGKVIQIDKTEKMRL